MTPAISAPRATWLLTKLRLRKGLNQVVGFYRSRKKDAKATKRTSPTLLLLTGFVALCMLFGISQFSWQGLTNIEDRFGSVQVKPPERGTAKATKQTDERTNESAPSAAKSALKRLPPAPGSALSAGVLQAVIFAATLLLFAALMLTIASREAARPEWDLEWLITLPIPLPTLLLSRLIERAVTGAAGFLLLAPFLSVLAWKCGYRWTAPLAGIGVTVPLLFLLAAAQAMYDTGLRLSLSPGKLRNIQAAFSIVGTLPMILAMSMGMAKASFVLDWIPSMPGWVNWLPPGLAVRTLATSDGTAWFSFTLLIAEALTVVVISFAVLQRQLRNGVVAGGAREAVARVKRVPRRSAALVGPGALSFLSPIQRRELLLLARDRTFMVQTLLVPATLVGMQIVFNIGSTTFNDALSNPLHLGAIAFALAGTTLMFSAFQTLNAEGQALWVLYCVPKSLESVLWQKAKMWAVVAAIFPIIILAGGALSMRDVSLQLVGVAAIVIAGVPIFATIATALGVFGCDPLEQDVRRRVRITYLYLFMLLVSMYVYAFYAISIWQTAGLIILTALLALALWQKARDQFDYLLDPAASPPARVSVSDGMIAALMFFVLQALVLALQLAIEGKPVIRGSMVWIAFCTAGAVTYVVMRLVYWRSGATEVPRMLNAGVGSALIWGVAGGLAAALVGVVYLQIVISFNLFPDIRQATRLADPAFAIWIAAMAIIAAPIFEEFIFRGLIFGGLRRLLGFSLAATASAAIFAIVHPPASVIPVFVLGFCAALVYEWKRMLIAPITVHAIYNTAIVAFQWSMTR